MSESNRHTDTREGRIEKEMPVAVAAECPMCTWRSAEVSLCDEPNAEWHARSEAAAQFRRHFEDHRPRPRFVRIEPT